MYYEYWGLQKPAFDNVPDPSMYVDCHASMESAIAETLFAIEEGDECIAVVVGDVGLGKTLSIRMIIDMLHQDKYKIVLITNPGISFVQILQEIIGQLTDKQCEEKRKVKLLEMFNRLLFSTFEEGKKILIFIDEANAITPINLESLRLLTNMQGDKRNLFTMVLAGQIEFAKRLEHPKRANLFQRVGTYSRIDKLGDADVVKKYVETRLALAGAANRIFTDDAFERLWEHSDFGVPRLINKLAKLCLKAGETNSFTVITGAVVDQIGSRFHKLTRPAVQKRRPRRRIPEDVPSSLPEEMDETDVLAAQKTETAEPVFMACKAEAAELRDDAPGKRDQVKEITVWQAAGDQWPFFLAESPSPSQEPEQPEQEETSNEAEMRIGNINIRIVFPEHLLKQSLSYSTEHKNRMAGGLAAETLKNNPQLMTSHFTDPVPIWQEIRDFILDRINHGSSMQSFPHQERMS
jgi:type II secretory pathway predicted ATPase ExeA